MPNAAVHALGAAITVGVGHLAHEQLRRQEPTGLPVLSAGVAYCCGSLPDHFEPALHPNHRQFFHSVAMGLCVGWVMKKTYEWKPDTAAQELVRYLSLVVGGAYLAHLLLDSLTKKSLPWFGKV